MRPIAVLSRSRWLCASPWCWASAWMSCCIPRPRNSPAGSPAAACSAAWSRSRSYPRANRTTSCAPSTDFSEARASRAKIDRRELMGTDVTQERQQAHALLDQLPNEKLTAVVHLLQAISDPVARSLANAPIDDEPISAEEMRAVEASREWLKDHAPLSHEEVLAEFGLTL